HLRTADRPGPQRYSRCTDSGILKTSSTERRAAGGDRPRSGGSFKMRLVRIPQPLPSVAARRPQLQVDVRVKNRLGIGAVGSHQSLPAIRSDEERTANALAAVPRAVLQPATLLKPAIHKRKSRATRP